MCGGAPIPVNPLADLEAPVNDKALGLWLDDDSTDTWLDDALASSAFEGLPLNTESTSNQSSTTSSASPDVPSASSINPFMPGFQDNFPFAAFDVKMTKTEEPEPSTTGKRGRNAGDVAEDSQPGKKKKRNREIERQRREELSVGIGKLAEVVPSCVATSSKLSKLHIVEKTYEYVKMFGEEVERTRRQQSLMEHQLAQLQREKQWLMTLVQSMGKNKAAMPSAQSNSALPFNPWGHC
eukprot:TRINITY_DN24396_c0_g1_i1.p1 TRINITY_DN24396_c0_g1~~TRINITY_DN24396_c0_g1_i1.p1  ORF type:complete len:238 (-),score=79.26 TRINITY_DN24396_c0_g1_i1:332-1045(-)